MYRVGVVRQQFIKQKQCLSFKLRIYWFNYPSSSWYIYHRRDMQWIPFTMDVGGCGGQRELLSDSHHSSSSPMCTSATPAVPPTDPTHQILIMSRRSHPFLAVSSDHFCCWFGIRKRAHRSHVQVGNQFWVKTELITRHFPTQRDQRPFSLKTVRTTNCCHWERCESRYLPGKSLGFYCDSGRDYLSPRSRG